jgi:peptidoglycan/LPS O-acetylase OafA/YrhL
VVASHFGAPALQGGFLGVDVFFVLSGFLITGLLVTELEASESIDLARFYSRRIRRLLPAMMVMVVAVFILAILLFPATGSLWGLEAAPYALTWISNLFFDFRELGYFENLEGQDFFLHTWSLAVDEQFYLVWPLMLLFLLGRSDIKMAPFLGSSGAAGMVWLALVSFALCVAMQILTIDSAFYQMPARIWEFAVGGLCAFVMGSSKIEWVSMHPKLRFLALRTAPLVGMLLIAGSACWVNDRTPNPGLATVLPVLGTALVILGGAAHPKAWGLSSKPLVWLGDRSYSIYLWHWPVAIFCQRLIVDQALLQVVSALLLTLLFSVLSYRFVECPFWKGRFSVMPRSLVLSSSLCSLIPALVLVIGVVGILDRQRLKTDNELLSQGLYIPSLYSRGCDDWYETSNVVPCEFGEESAERHLVYIGDSIGMQWFSAVDKVFLRSGWRMTVFTKSACPLVNRPIYYERINQVYEVCEVWRNNVLGRISDLAPDLVIAGSSSSYDYSQEQWVEGSRDVFSDLRSASEQVVVLAGTPKLPFDGLACI